MPLAIIASGIISFIYLKSLQIDLDVFELNGVPVPLHIQFLYGDNATIFNFILASVFIGLVFGGLVALGVYVFYYIKENGLSANTLIICFVALSFATYLLPILAIATIPYYIHVVKRYIKVVKFKGMSDIF